MNEKNKIIDIKKEKERIQKIEAEGKKSLKIIIAVIILVSVLLGTYFLAVVKEKPDFSDDNIYYSQANEKGGFPVSFTSNDIIACEAFSSRIYVLTGKTLSSYKSNGENSFNIDFTFVDPAMAVSEKYGLIFDRGSSKYFVFNQKGLYYEGTTDGDRHIIQATVDNEGNCAFVTKSEDSACRVSFVNKAGKLIYMWSCAEEYVVALDISSDSKEILCGAVGAYNGDILTKVYKLDMDSSETEKSFSLVGSGCVDVSFYGMDKAIVSCLDKRVILNFRTEDGAPVEAAYSTDAEFIYSDGNGYTAVVTEKINSFDSVELSLYDKNNSVQYKTELPKDIVDVKVYGKKVYCLSRDSVLYLDAKGKVRKQVPCESKGDGLVILSSKAYYYTVGNLRTGF
ncbi:MAG: DUF5711 family protein [Acutalibacteraceae bacterium]|nr:DUF5711 family protein [Acutalibacteraceae bacterium]